MMSGPQEEHQARDSLVQPASEVARKYDKDVFGPDFWQLRQIKRLRDAIQEAVAVIRRPRVNDLTQLDQHHCQMTFHQNSWS